MAQIGNRKHCCASIVRSIMRALVALALFLAPAAAFTLCAPSRMLTLHRAAESRAMSSHALKRRLGSLDMSMIAPSSSSAPASTAPPPPPPPTGLQKIVTILSLMLKIAVLRMRNMFLRMEGLVLKNKLLRSRQFWLQMTAALVSYVVLARAVRVNRALTSELSFATFLRLLDKHPDKLSSLRVSAAQLSYVVAGQRTMTRVVQADRFLLERLLASGVDFAAPPAPVNVLGLLWTCVYGFFLWTVTSRMMQGPQDEGAGKRKDQANFGTLSFDDVAGQERAKLEIKEVCEMLRAPAKYAAVGARLPSGCLLVGPPGTGKTLLARVAAAEAGVPFYACSATDFVEVFVGRGPARVRKLFKQAAESAPCIVFIDEIDSLGRSRRAGSMNSEQENTLNQLLTSMDGLDTSNNGVVVMGATNRLELLDPALLRPGRFDRIVQCPLPDKAGRQGILQVHTRRLLLDPGVDLERVARITPGTCGADLASISNEAAIRTVRRGASSVSSDDFEDAVRSFFGGRGVSVTGFAEALVPAWLRGEGAGQPQPAPGM